MSELLDSLQTPTGFVQGEVMVTQHNGEAARPTRQILEGFGVNVSLLD